MAEVEVVEEERRRRRERNKEIEILFTYAITDLVGWRKGVD